MGDPRIGSHQLTCFELFGPEASSGAASVPAAPRPFGQSPRPGDRWLSIHGGPDSSGLRRYSITQFGSVVEEIVEAEIRVPIGPQVVSHLVVDRGDLLLIRFPFSIGVFRMPQGDRGQGRVKG